MERREFYNETKWCEHCRRYVRYLMSVESSYCVHCSGKVRLFSETDAEHFTESLEKKRWKVS